MKFKIFETRRLTNDRTGFIMSAESIEEVYEQLKNTDFSILYYVLKYNANSIEIRSKIVLDQWFKDSI